MVKVNYRRLLKELAKSPVKAFAMTSCSTSKAAWKPHDILSFRFCMKIHEYQAKAILSQYNVPVPRGEVAFTVEEAEVAAKKIAGSVVVKAQIHAGGRGKGGGVKVAKDSGDAAQIARKILGMQLVTHQTGPEGRIVQRLLIEETLPIERELYLGIVLDRVQGKPVFMGSSAGGMEIEEVARKTPELILKETLDGTGLSPF